MNKEQGYMYNTLTHVKTYFEKGVWEVVEGYIMMFSHFSFVWQCYEYSNFSVLDIQVYIWIHVLICKPITCNNKDP